MTIQTTPPLTDCVHRLYLSSLYTYKKLIMRELCVFPFFSLKHLIHFFSLRLCLVVDPLQTHLPSDRASSLSFSLLAKWIPIVLNYTHIHSLCHHITNSITPNLNEGKIPTHAWKWNYSVNPRIFNGLYLWQSGFSIVRRFLTMEYNIPSPLLLLFAVQVFSVIVYCGPGLSARSFACIYTVCLYAYMHM